jgi:hypothetical protein
MHKLCLSLLACLFLLPAIALDQELTLPSEDKPKDGNSESMFDVLFGSSSNPDFQLDIGGVADERILIPESQQQWHMYNGAELVLIDKSIGMRYTERLPTGTKKNIKDFVITVHSCWKPKERGFTPDARAFLEIYEGEKKVFHNWILGDFPSINPVGHEKWEIIVSDCVSMPKN